MNELWVNKGNQIIIKRSAPLKLPYELIKMVSINSKCSIYTNDLFQNNLMMMMNLPICIMPPCNKDTSKGFYREKDKKMSLVDC